MTERQLTTSVQKAIRKEYPSCWIYKTNDRFTAGIPDLILCFYGRFVAIELKIGKNKLTRLQVYTGNRIGFARGYFGCCRTVNEVIEFLNLIEKEMK